MKPATDQPSRARALAELHLAVALFGFAGLFAKWIALPAIGIVFGRTLIASIALATLLHFRGERALAVGIDRRFALNGAVLAVHWLAFFEAIQLASVAIGLLGFASFPLFVLLLEAATGQRRLRARDWTTAALVTLGLLLVVPEFRWANRAAQGLACGVVSGFAFALLAVRNRALAAAVSPGAIALWQNAWAALCLLPFTLVASVSPTPGDAALLVVLGVVCTALAHTLFIGALRVASAHVASVVAALEPVYGIALAFLLLGEAPDRRTLLGGALLVAAALWATRTAAFGARDAIR